jgi:hypothetical protein
MYEPPYITNTGGALTADAFWQHRPKGGAYRGVERIYPASVVKLFYLVAVHEWLQQGMLQPSDRARPGHAGHDCRLQQRRHQPRGR